jgi:hypothetical protein
VPWPPALFKTASGRLTASRVQFAALRGADVALLHIVRLRRRCSPAVANGGADEVGISLDAVTKPGGSVDRFYGKYLTLRARQPDGTWRFIADGGASSPPPSP